MKDSNLQIVIKTLPGLERVLAREVRQLGGREVQEVRRGIVCKGDLGFVFKCNLWLRTALRVLVQLDRFQVRDEKNLYKKVYETPWEKYFDSDKTIAIDATVHSDRFRNSLFVAQKTKDGIVDRFRDQSGKRPSVDLKNPDIRINVHIQNHFCTLSLDSSGESLHKRGYRVEVDKAPLGEVLAAGILSLMDWQGKGPLLDPMCGSGTFLTEAALFASNVPVNVFRKQFSFQNWKDYDAALFDTIFESSMKKENRDLPPIYGFDIDPQIGAKARRNVKNALMEDVIKVQKRNFLNWPEDEKVAPGTTLIMNPPYDLKLEADIPELYKGIGDSLKQHFSGCTAWVFTASAEGLKHLGLKPTKKIPLKNAKLDSWLVRYDLYEGSKKASN